MEIGGDMAASTAAASCLDFISSQNHKKTADVESLYRRHKLFDGKTTYDTHHVINNVLSKIDGQDIGSGSTGNLEDKISENSYLLGKNTDKNSIEAPVSTTSSTPNCLSRVNSRLDGFSLTEISPLTSSQVASLSPLLRVCCGSTVPSGETPSDILLGNRDTGRVCGGAFTTITPKSFSNSLMSLPPSSMHDQKLAEESSISSPTAAPASIPVAGVPSAVPSTRDTSELDCHTPMSLPVKLSLSPKSSISPIPIIAIRGGSSSFSSTVSTSSRPPSPLSVNSNISPSSFSSSASPSSSMTVSLSNLVDEDSINTNATTGLCPRVTLHSDSPSDSSPGKLSSDAIVALSSSLLGVLESTLNERREMNQLSDILERRDAVEEIKVGDEKFMTMMSTVRKNDADSSDNDDVGLDTLVATSSSRLRHTELSPSSSLSSFSSSSINTMKTNTVGHGPDFLVVEGKGNAVKGIMGDDSDDHTDEGVGGGSEDVDGDESENSYSRNVNRNGDKNDFCSGSDHQIRNTGTNSGDNNDIMNDSIGKIESNASTDNLVISLMRSGTSLSTLFSSNNGSIEDPGVSSCSGSDDDNKDCGGESSITDLPRKRLRVTDSGEKDHLLFVSSTEKDSDVTKEEDGVIKGAIENSTGLKKVKTDEDTVESPSSCTHESSNLPSLTQPSSTSSSTTGSGSDVEKVLTGSANKSGDDGANCNNDDTNTIHSNNVAVLAAQMMTLRQQNAHFQSMHPLFQCQAPTAPSPPLASPGLPSLGVSPPSPSQQLLNAQVFSHQLMNPHLFNPQSVGGGSFQQHHQTPTQQQFFINDNSSVLSPLAPAPHHPLLASSLTHLFQPKGDTNPSFSPPVLKPPCPTSPLSTAPLSLQCSSQSDSIGTAGDSYGDTHGISNYDHNHSGDNDSDDTNKNCENDCVGSTFSSSTATTRSSSPFTAIHPQRMVKGQQLLASFAPSDSSTNSYQARTTDCDEQGKDRGIGVNKYASSRCGGSGDNSDNNGANSANNGSCGDGGIGDFLSSDKKDVVEKEASGNSQDESATQASSKCTAGAPPSLLSQHSLNVPSLILSSQTDTSNSNGNDSNACAPFVLPYTTSSSAPQHSPSFSPFPFLHSASPSVLPSSLTHLFAHKNNNAVSASSESDKVTNGTGGSGVPKLSNHQLMSQSDGNLGSIGKCHSFSNLGEISTNGSSSSSGSSFNGGISPALPSQGTASICASSGTDATNKRTCNGENQTTNILNKNGLHDGENSTIYTAQHSSQDQHLTSCGGPSATAATANTLASLLSHILPDPASAATAVVANSHSQHPSCGGGVAVGNGALFGLSSLVNSHPHQHSPFSIPTHHHPQINTHSSNPHSSACVSMPSLNGMPSSSCNNSTIGVVGNSIGTAAGNVFPNGLTGNGGNIGYGGGMIVGLNGAFHTHSHQMPSFLPPGVNVNIGGVNGLPSSHPLSATTRQPPHSNQIQNIHVNIHSFDPTIQHLKAVTNDMSSTTSHQHPVEKSFAVDGGNGSVGSGGDAKSTTTSPPNPSTAGDDSSNTSDQNKTDNSNGNKDAKSANNATDNTSDNIKHSHSNGNSSSTAHTDNSSTSNGISNNIALPDTTSHPPSFIHPHFFHAHQILQSAASVLPPASSSMPFMNNLAASGWLLQQQQLLHSQQHGQSPLLVMKSEDGSNPSTMGGGPATLSTASGGGLPGCVYSPQQLQPSSAVGVGGLDISSMPSSSPSAHAQQSNLIQDDSMNIKIEQQRQLSIFQQTQQQQQFHSQAFFPQYNSQPMQNFSHLGGPINANTNEGNNGNIEHIMGNVSSGAMNGSFPFPNSDVLVDGKAAGPINSLMLLNSNKNNSACGPAENGGINQHSNSQSSTPTTTSSITSDNCNGGVGGNADDGNANNAYHNIVSLSSSDFSNGKNGICNAGIATNNGGGLNSLDGNNDLSTPLSGGGLGGGGIEDLLESLGQEERITVPIPCSGNSEMIDLSMLLSQQHGTGKNSHDHSLSACCGNADSSGNSNSTVSTSTDGDIIAGGGSGGVANDQNVSAIQALLTEQQRQERQQRENQELSIISSLGLQCYGGFRFPGVSFSPPKQVWRARITIDGRQYEQQFSVKKKGFEGARVLAIRWRLRMQQKVALGQPLEGGDGANSGGVVGNGVGSAGSGGNGSPMIENNGGNTSNGDPSNNPHLGIGGNCNNNISLGSLSTASSNEGSFGNGSSGGTEFSSISRHHQGLYSPTLSMESGVGGIASDANTNAMMVMMTGGGGGAAEIMAHPASSQSSTTTISSSQQSLGCGAAAPVLGTTVASSPSAHPMMDQSTITDSNTAPQPLLDLWCGSI